MASTTKGYDYPIGTDRVVDGDNVMQALATDIDTMAGVSAMGTVTMPTVAAGAIGSLVITFPAGRFTAPPWVQATMQGTASFVSIGRAPSVSAISATGCTIYHFRDSGTGGANVFWWAVQL